MVAVTDTRPGCLQTERCVLTTGATWSLTNCKASERAPGVVVMTSRYGHIKNIQV